MMGSITVSIEDATGYTSYTVGSPDEAEVPVRDNDPMITIETDDSSIVGGENAEFTIQAEGAPISNLWINIDVDDTGNYLADPAPSRGEAPQWPLVGDPKSAYGIDV